MGRSSIWSGKLAGERSACSARLDAGDARMAGIYSPTTRPEAQHKVDADLLYGYKKVPCIEQRLFK